MPQERMKWLYQRVDANEPVAHSPDHFTKIISTKIGQFLSLDVAPHAFHWVQIRRLGGEAYNR